ncbi:MAG: DUF4435 domain-containing protein [Lutisporaceae bacterium]
MRNYIDGTRLVTKIKMLRILRKEKCYFIVEGDTDARLYRKFIDEESCDIVIAESKENVIEAISILNNMNFSGVLGIVDNDFWVLDNYKNSINNLFVTDHHDLEVMMINSNAFEHVFAEYADQIKYHEFIDGNIKDIRTRLVDNSSIIGYLRWYSQRNNKNLDFGKIDFYKFVDLKSLEINIDKLINTVIDSSKLASNLESDIVKKEIKKLQDKKCDLLHVCCGHDLTELLSIGFREIFGAFNAKNLFSGGVAGSLRLAYVLSYFESTTLYKQLFEWQSKNVVYRIFPIIEYEEAI